MEAVCSEMVVAKSTAEFEDLLTCLDAEFGKYLVHIMVQMDKNTMIDGPKENHFMANRTAELSG